MSKEDDGRLNNPFNSAGSPVAKENPDFIAFSSTPVPGDNHKNFSPRRGKKFRQQNWQRFGNGQQEQQQQQQNWQSPYQRNNSTRPPFSPFRGRGGSPFGGGGGGGGGGGQHPHFYSNNSQSPQQFGRNNNRDRNGQQRFQHNDSGGSQKDGYSSFYHPSMVEDPWSQFDTAFNDDDDSKKMQSDSMIPQFGDSLLDRNVSELMSKNESGITVNPAPDLEEEEEEEEPAADLTADEERISESLIAQAGDSILPQDVSSNDTINDLTVNDDTVDESIAVQVGDQSDNNIILDETNDDPLRE